MGWELSLRYILAKEQCASLYGVAILGIFSLEGDGRVSPLLLPGVGLGANADIIHVEVKFHKWPGLVWRRVGQYGPKTTTWHSDYLDYAVGLLLGIEFTLLKF